MLMNDFYANRANRLDWIENKANRVGWIGTVAFAINFIIEEPKLTGTNPCDLCIVGTSLPETSAQPYSVELVIPKKNFRDRYAKAAQSEWFKKAYDNRSIGDIMGLDS
jgi:hypothetical protein